MLSRKRQAELKEKRAALNYPIAKVSKINPDQITINDQVFSIEENYREGLDLDALADRYMDILDMYDYVVGDWSYEQLRLKGFYANEAKVGTLEQKIKHLPDYLIEYSSFGAAYFVLAHERSASEIQLRNELFWENQKQFNREPKQKTTKVSQGSSRVNKKNSRYKKQDFKAKKDYQDQGQKRQRAQSKTRKKANSRNQSFNIVENTNPTKETRPKNTVKKKVVAKRQHSFSIKEKGDK